MEITTIKATNRLSTKKKWLLLVVCVIILICLFATVFAPRLGLHRTSPPVRQDSSALNTHLPEAKLPERTGIDKFAMYTHVEMDSMRLADQLKMQSMTGLLHPKDKGALKSSADSNALSMSHQIDSLRNTINYPQQRYNRTPIAPSGYRPPPESSNPSIERLERMIQTIKRQDETPDADLADFKSILEKMDNLQHPKKSRDSTRNEILYTVLPSSSLGSAHIWTDSSARSAAWHDLDDVRQKDSANARQTMQAFIPETQKLSNGGIIRMELATDLALAHQLIPAGASVYGVCRLEHARLQVAVSAIRYQQQVYPVALTVLDQDGMPGIRVRESLSGDALRETGAQEAGSFSVGGVETNLAGQATATGLQLARSLAAKKVREVRITVSEGYRVWLKDNSRK